MMFNGQSSAVNALTAALARPEWYERAACRGMSPDLFFPERGQAVTQIQQVCVGCPVRSECADAGMGEHHGIWGGLSERQRRAMRRESGVVKRTYPRPPCGTEAGYMWHRRHGEEACAGCLEGLAAATRRRRFKAVSS